jgi:hypothetical protein
MVACTKVDLSAGLEEFVFTLGLSQDLFGFSFYSTG